MLTYRERLSIGHLHLQSSLRSEVGLEDILEGFSSIDVHHQSLALADDISVRVH